MVKGKRSLFVYLYSTYYEPLILGAEV